ncbi:MAG TPA: hypothetical protein VF984_08875 [Actinomycetota bacterium]
MRKYSLIDDGQGNYRYGNGYEQFEEQEKLPEPDHKSTLRALLRDADEVIKQMTLDELKAKITAILPGATFEVDDLGQIVIRSSFRLHTDPEALAETLREKARDYVPLKKGLFGRGK